MGYNIQAARRRVQAALKRWGGKAARTAVLIEIDTGRTIPVIMARREWTPREVSTVALNAEAQIIVSALTLDEADFPNHDMHEIFYAGVLYRIIDPVTGPRPSGPRPTHFECRVSAKGRVNYLNVFEPIDLDVGYDQYNFYKPLRILNRDEDGVPQPIEMLFGYEQPSTLQVTVQLQGATFEFGTDIDLSELEHYQLEELEASNIDLGLELSLSALEHYRPLPFVEMGFGYELDAQLASTEILAPTEMDFGFALSGDLMRTQYLQPGNMEFGYQLDGPVSADVTVYLQPGNMALGFEQNNVIERVTYLSSNLDFGFDQTHVLTHVNPDSGDATATLGGTAQALQTITCVFNDNDPDGPATGVAYKWQGSANGTSGWFDISGGNSTLANYPIENVYAGYYLRCRVSYTDGNGNAEVIYSNVSDQIAAAPPTNVSNRMVLGLNAAPWFKVFDRNDQGVVMAAPAVAPNGALYYAQISKDGRTIAFGSANGHSEAVLVYDLSSGVPVKMSVDLTGVTNADTYSFALSRDGEWMALGRGSAPRLCVWKRSGSNWVQCAISGTALTAAVQSMVFNDEGTKLFVGSTLSGVHLHDYTLSGTTATKAGGITGQPSVIPTGLACANNRLAAFYASASVISRWTLTSSGTLAGSKTDSGTTASASASADTLVMSDNGAYLAYARSATPFVEMWDLSSMTKVTLPAAGGSTRGLAFNDRSDELVATQLVAGVANVYRQNSLTAVWEAAGTRALASGIVSLGSGRMSNVAGTGAATVSYTGTAGIGSAITAVLGADPDGTASAITYEWQKSANGSTGWALAGGTQGNAAYTAVAGDEGNYLRAVVRYTDGTGHTEWVAGPATNYITPDRIAFALNQSPFVVTMNGNTRYAAPGTLPNASGAVAISPNGRYVAYWSPAGNTLNHLRVYDYASGAAVLVFQGENVSHPSTFYSGAVSFSPDGAYLVLVNNDTPDYSDNVICYRTTDWTRCTGTITVADRCITTAWLNNSTFFVGSNGGGLQAYSVSGTTISDHSFTLGTAHGLSNAGAYLRGVAFPSSTRMVLIGDVSPFIASYTLTGGTWVKDTAWAALPALAVTIDVSPADPTKIVLAFSGTTQPAIYDINTRSAVRTITTTGNKNAARYSRDGSLIFISPTTAATRLHVHDVAANTTNTTTGPAWDSGATLTVSHFQVNR